MADGHDVTFHLIDLAPRRYLFQFVSVCRCSVSIVSLSTGMGCVFCNSSDMVCITNPVALVTQWLENMRSAPLIWNITDTNTAQLYLFLSLLFVRKILWANSTFIVLILVALLLMSMIKYVNLNFVFSCFILNLRMILDVQLPQETIVFCFVELFDWILKGTLCLTVRSHKSLKIKEKTWDVKGNFRFGSRFLSV